MDGMDGWMDAWMLVIASSVEGGEDRAPNVVFIVFIKKKKIKKKMLPNKTQLS